VFKWLSLLSILVFAMTSAIAQPENAAASAQFYQGIVASPEGRTWILQAWGTRLGAEAECTQGKSWVFFADGLLVKRTCVDGQIAEQQHNWSIKATQAGPIELTIDTTAHWIEILTDKITEPGLPPSEVLIAKIQETRDFQEERVPTYQLKRTKDE